MDLQIKSMQNSALKNQLSYKLAVLYFSWDFSFCQTTVQKTLVSQLEAAVAQIKELRAGGVASSVKVLEAQAKLENAKVALCASENTTDSLKLELTDFIQYGDSAIIPENYDFKIDSLYISSIDTISLDVFRPELSALDLSAEQLSVYMDILSGQKYPNLVLSAGYHYGRPELNMGNNPDYMGYAIAALKFNFNIFDGYKISSMQSQAQQQIEMVRSRKKQLTNSFVNSIKSAKQDFLRAQRQKNAARISLEASHALAEDVKNSLNSGVSTSLDYLNALSSEAVAECGVKQAQFMEKMALLKIYYASGKELKY
jgi:outer membrane protein TolC